MKQTSERTRELRGLMVAICTLVMVITSLSAWAVRAEKSVPGQEPGTAQTPAGSPSPTPTRTVTPAPTPSPTPTPINLSTDPMLKRFIFRGIGPASMGGRIDDIAAVDSNPYVYYVGFATGGVWKTTNNGTTFQPIFDIYSTASIGDIAIAPSNADIVWVGTGEANNRQSSSFGVGIYKSTDGGKTFTKMGLENSQTIARIIIDPKNPDTVYVAVLGHLFGPNKERGIYKTSDGGKTWNNVKFIDEDTGFTDPSTLLRISVAGHRGVSTAAVQARESGRLLTREKPGRGCKATACPRVFWVVSELTSVARTQTSCMPKLKLEPALAPAVKKLERVQHPHLRLRRAHLRRRHRM